MKQTIFYLLLIFLCHSLFAVNQLAASTDLKSSAESNSTQASDSQSIPEKSLYHQDRILVQLNVESYARTDLPAEVYGTADAFGLPELDSFFRELGGIEIKRAFLPLKDKEAESRFGFRRWFIACFDSEVDIPRTVEAFRNRPEIDFAKLISYVERHFIPNDLYYPNTWGHNNTAQFPSFVDGEWTGPPVGQVGFDSKAEQAWSESQGLGSASVIIAIIDTGVDLTHPDLRLVAGYDAADNDDDPSPPPVGLSQGHGTCCAGIAAGIGNNSIGITGIAAGCSIMPVKDSHDATGQGTEVSVTNGILWATDHGAHIISMSFGFYGMDYGDSPALDGALDYAYNNGITLFASTGNGNSTTIGFPAKHPHVISVGAAAPGGERKSDTSCDGVTSWGSNYGVNIPDDRNAVDICAPTYLPATDIQGTAGYVDGSYYLYFGGTSCSSPYAAGVAALLKSRYLFLTPDQIEQAIKQTATDMTIDGGAGWDRYTGYGLVNAYGAMLWAPPGCIWTGSFSSSWNNTSNWSSGTIPTILDDVYIPSGTPNDPLIYTNQNCNSISISNGASITITTGNLEVEQNFVNYGTLIMYNADGILRVNNNLVFGVNSSAQITAAAYIFVKGNLDLNSPVNMQNGTLRFWGDVDSQINTYAPSALYNLQLFKTAGYSVSISDQSFAALTINNNITINSGNTLYQSYGGETILKGTIIVNTGGVCQLNSGTLKMTGNANRSLNLGDSGNYLNGLNISKDSGYTVTLTNNLTIKGDLTITNGVFAPGGWGITMSGNWINTAGPSAFNEATSRVIFNGSEHQYCNFTENFNILEVNKTGGALRVNSSVAVVTCAAYDWTAGAVDVLTGTFTANSLSDNAIYGSWYLNAGGTINLTHTGYVDLNGELYIYGGNFNVYGGSDASYWPYLANASITMSNGILDFKNRGININNEYGYTLTENITGGTIRTVGNLNISRTDFTPSGGTVELYGIADATMSHAAGSNFHHLYINKASAREDGSFEQTYQLNRDGSRSRLERNNNVSAQSNLVIKGSFVIDTGTFTAPAQMNVGLDWMNYPGPAAFNEGTGKVVFDGAGNSNLQSEIFNNLEISKTGSAYVRVNSGSTVTCNSYLCPSGKLYVTGGTFNALSTPSNVIAGTMQLTAGEIHFYQATNDVVDICANITISGGTLFINGGMGTVYLPGMGNASLTMSGGVIDVLDIAISIVSGLTFTTNITGGTIRTARDFYCYRSDFNPTGSSILEMYSSTDAVISMSNGSLYNLNINKSSRDGDDRDRANTVTANTNLDINGSFTLQSGTFIAPAQMNVARHWTNNAGAAAFIEGSGMVIFDGSLNSYIYNETFNNLGLNKPGSSAYINPSNTVSCITYTWTAGTLSVSGGTFDILTLTGGVIAGTFNVTAGALNFYRGSENYAYFRADATISGGGLYIRGGNITTFFGNGSSASLTMSGGVFDVTDMGISFQTAVPFVTNITGGTIRASKNFACYRSDFNPPGGTLEMYSSIDANLYMSAGTLYNLKINKAARDEDRETTRANTATASSNLVINGDFILQSGNFIAPATINIRGNWFNNVSPAAYAEGTGSVIFDGDSIGSIMTQEVFNNVILNKTAPSHLSIPAGANASCNTFSRTAGKLLVEGGIFSVLTLPDGVIAGVYEVTSGELNFHRGTANNAYFRADVSITDGEFKILGGTGYTFFGNGSSASLTMTGGVLDVTDMGISFQTAFPFVTSIDYGTIRTARNFYCYRADFNPYFAAIVEMYSSYDAEIHMSAGTLPQFYVNKSARDEDSGDYRSNLVTLTSDITSSSIRIDSGSLKINGHTAQVDGSIFVCGTLIMDNPADYLDILNLMVWEDGSYAQLTLGTISIDQSWKVMSGATVQIPAAVTTYFTGIDNSSAYVRKFLIQAENFHFGSLVFDGDDPDRTYTIDANSTHSLGVAGDLTITSNYTLIASTIDIIVNGSLNLQGTLNIMETDVSVDEKANLAISSTLTIDTGAFSFHDSSSPTLTQLNGTLVINSGNFTAQNHTLSVTNTSNLTISGGYINCTGLYAAQANAFQPTGGTLTIMGNPSQSIMYMTVSNGNWLHNFNVETDSAVRLNATLQVNGNISIENGRLDLNSNTLNCNGDINVEYGILEVDAAASLSLTSLKTLNVWAGSRLELLGTSSYPATLTNSTGRTSVNIESGATVAANYAVIEKIASPGFNVKPGALVDAANSFHNCTFFDSSANRALLVLDNNQNLAIFNATFPTNIWSGAYNVRKNVDSGLVNFVNASGGFAGESYDKDDFNRIFWTQNSVPAQPELQIVKAVWSDTNPGLGETTTLTVTYLNASTTAAGSNYLDLYYNRSTPPPWMLAGDQFVLLPSVPAGIPQEVSFDVTESFTPGSWNSWLLIDRNRNVGETDETNNSFGPVPITWNLVILQPVTNLTIEYLPAVNHMRLNWNYSTSVTRFKIYRSNDPNFTPSPANYLASVTYPAMSWTDTALGLKNFYIVTAEIEDAAAAAPVAVPPRQSVIPSRWNE